MNNYIKGKVIQVTDGSEAFEWGEVRSWKGNRILYSSIDAIDADLNTTDFHVSLPVKGEELYLVDGKNYSATKGEYFIFNPQQEVRAAAQFKERVDGICIFISEEIIQETSYAMNQSIEKAIDHPFVYEWQQQEFMVKNYQLKENGFGQYLDQLQYLLLNHYEETIVDWNTFYFDLATKFLMTHRQIGDQLQSIKSTKMLTKQEIYRRLSLAHCYILEEYGEPFSLEDLERVAFFSKYHIVRLYRQIYGLTPYQHVLKLRVEKAKQLLKENYSPTEIAGWLSFSDRRAFSKVFKKIVGVSPSQFQENLK